MSKELEAIKLVLDLQKIYKISNNMANEFVEAVDRYGFPPFNSFHEGYAVFEEELDELWEEVKKCPKQDIIKLKKEAIQIGAMAIRFVYDLLESEEK